MGHLPSHGGLAMKRKEKTMKLLSDVNWFSVGPVRKIPEEYWEEWGDKWGHPVYDKKHRLIGYANQMPASDEDEYYIEFMPIETTKKNKVLLTISLIMAAITTWMLWMVLQNI